MNYIYYIVSEVSMEILQLLTSFLSNNQNLKVLAPIIEILRANNFDIK